MEVMTRRLIQVKNRESKLTLKYLNPASPAVSLVIKDYNYAPLTHPPVSHNSRIAKYRELSAECILSDLRILKMVNWVPQIIGLEASSIDRFPTSMFYDTHKSKAAGLS